MIKVKRRMRGSVILITVALLGTLTLLIATLRHTSIMQYMRNELKTDVETRYNLLSLAEYTFDYTVAQACGYRLETVESPIKGEGYYQGLLDAITAKFVLVDNKASIPEMNALILQMPIMEDKFRDSLLEAMGPNGVDKAEVTVVGAFRMDVEATLDGLERDSKTGEVEYADGNIIYMMPIDILVKLKEGNVIVSRAGTVSGLVAVASYESGNVILDFDDTLVTIIKEDVRVW